MQRRHGTNEAGSNRWFKKTGDNFSKQAERRLFLFILLICQINSIKICTIFICTRHISFKFTASLRVCDGLFVRITRFIRGDKCECYFAVSTSETQSCVRSCWLSINLSVPRKAYHYVTKIMLSYCYYNPDFYVSLLNAPLEQN